MKQFANLSNTGLPHAGHQKGFTLVELSIVLVIISFIVGGVFMGQGLVQNAQIRATINQIGRYETAVNTFRAKYNGLPGDLANGGAFFPAVANQAAVPGQGNGDGLVGSISAANTSCAANNCMAGENLLFWYELYQAGLITDTTNSISDYANVSAVMSASVLPNSKMIGQIAVQSANGLNYWVMAKISGTAAAGVPTYAASLTPIQAFAIDNKLDDGVPSSGTVQSISGGVPGVAANLTTAATVTATTCGTSDTHAYALGTLNGNNNANLSVCQLGVRTSF